MAKRTKKANLEIVEETAQTMKEMEEKHDSKEEPKEGKQEIPEPMPTHFTIAFKDVQAVEQYMEKQPYSIVAPIINHLRQTLVPVFQNK